MREPAISGLELELWDDPAAWDAGTGRLRARPEPVAARLTVR